MRVTTPEPFGGDAPAPAIWDVATSDPDDAVKRVSERIRAIDERIEAVQALSAAAMKVFGLNHGEAKERL